MANTTVSQYKVDLAKEALISNPSITAQAFADQIKCCYDSAMLALKQARKDAIEKSRDIQQRAEALKRERAEKALEASELQIRDRLQTLRDNAETLQRAADDAEGTVEDIQAANQAWKQLTDYERLVTGIAAAERAATASAGKTEISLQIPLSNQQIDQIKPVN